MDLVEQRLWRDIWESGDPAVAREHGVEARSFGPVQTTIIRDLEDVRWVNLVLGAAAPDAVKAGHLAAAIEWADSTGVAYYVPVTPGAPAAAAAESWLRDNGFERGYGWMKFRWAGGSPDPDPGAGVAVVRATEPADGQAFGAIVAAGFGLPDWIASVFGGLAFREDWRCYLAEVDGEPVATGAMRLHDGMAELAFGATLESARGRGCQGAILRRRVADAMAAGCETIFVETGERQEGRPSISYRNILRAGFEEAYLRPNWQRPA